MPLTNLVDGQAVAADTRARLADGVVAFVAEHGEHPGLATILVGDDPASAVYVAAKHRACREVGIVSFQHVLAADVSQEELLALVDRLNADERVSGVLCQLPLPDHLDASAIVNRIDAAKDVDGLTVTNAGRLALGLDGLRPCTPVGVMLLLERIGVGCRGAHAVVIGRSDLFGKPMAQLLLGADATVTVCHSHTRDLPAICRQADILVAAVGRARMVKRDWVKPGATVIDVGINRTAEGLVGDVDLDQVGQVAGRITPVPGGVGPMTIVCLLANTLRAASSQRGAAAPVLSDAR